MALRIQDSAFILTNYISYSYAHEGTIWTLIILKFRTEAGRKTYNLI